MVAFGACSETGTSVPVRVAVKSRRGAMGGPACVGDAAMRIEHLRQVQLGLVDELLELGHLAHLLEGEHLMLLVAIDSKARRVVPAIFQAGKTYICREIYVSDCGSERSLSVCEPGGSSSPRPHVAVKGSGKTEWALRKLQQGDVDRVAAPFRTYR